MNTNNKSPDSELLKQLNQLTSENQNPNTLDIDLLNSLEIVKKINQEDHKVSLAVEKILHEIAKTVDWTVSAFNNGGRLVFMGAGTSGRLGVLDAVECIPTFSIEQGEVIGLIAGGEAAMFKAQEGAEDSMEAGQTDLKKINLTSKDILVGIAASGRTPYVIGGLTYAQKLGVKRIALSCNANAEICQYADISLLPIVGPEVLAGSTRMKSATAQKMVLNMLTTASMIRLGKTYQNLMVDVKATNQKLYARSLKMIMQITGVEQPIAEAALEQADNQVKLATLMLLTGKDAKSAELLLNRNQGFLRKAQINL